MTNQEWLDKVRANEQVLINLIGSYHPSMYSGKPPGNLPITARITESACEIVREKIRNETDSSPIGSFKDALEDGNVDIVYSLLSAAWFGVPESTLCWQIEGFKEAVDLMDDQPEMENEDENEEGDEQ